MEASLIVTYEPNHKASSKEEVENVFYAVDAKPKFLDSKYGGVFLLSISKPKEIVKELKKLAKKNVKLFARTFHYIPVDKWVKSEIKEMQKAIKPLVKNIKEKEKWKMDLSMRYYDKHDFKELIEKLTEVVDRENVDLDKPEKIIKVEIIEDKAAISLLEPEEFLETPKI
jgi:tRNA(Ser,Leu) C12 N-acetylase TAN1